MTKTFTIAFAVKKSELSKFRIWNVRPWLSTSGIKTLASEIAEIALLGDYLPLTWRETSAVYFFCKLQIREKEKLQSI
jgi:hypothetical protein